MLTIKILATPQIFTNSKNIKNEVKNKIVRYFSFEFFMRGGILFLSKC